MEESQNKYSGLKLYHPGIIMFYFLLGGLPLGLSLYSLNIFRRGQVWMGRFLFILSVVTFIMLVTAAVSGNGLSGLGIVGLFIGLGILKMEWLPFTTSIEKGAKKAKWYPPLLIVLGLYIIIILAMSSQLPN